MNDYAETIKQTVTMLDVCDRFGIDVNRSGKALCPFHPDRRPSMQVYPGAGGYHCFVCGVGGDVIDFYKRYYNIGFLDAVSKINDDFCLGLDVQNRTKQNQTEQRQAAEIRKQRIQAIHNERKRLEQAYNDALTNWRYWDSLKEKSAPRSIEDDLSDSYVYACQHIEQAANDMDRAWAALQAFTLKQKQDNRTVK